VRAGASFLEETIIVNASVQMLDSSVHRFDPPGGGLTRRDPPAVGSRGNPKPAALPRIIGRVAHACRTSGEG
jgi:hypothetical protein